MMTSTYLPKYLPAELVEFMNTRAGAKILFATDFPFLPLGRAVASARARCRRGRAGWRSASATTPDDFSSADLHHGVHRGSQRLPL